MLGVRMYTRELGRFYVTNNNVIIASNMMQIAFFETSNIVD